MYRNQYDTDCITWSPQGRIFQIEYAMEAAKQGTCVVGLCSKKSVVLGSLKRAAAQLATHQQKLFRIDDHIGIAISGLTADARVLSKFMRTECLHYKYIYDVPMPVGRIAAEVGDKSQINTQRGSKRPYGVGLLVAGYDENGPHLFETCPSGNFYEYVAMALGARAQSGKTYLEKHFETFPDSDEPNLIRHALKSLSASTQEQELTVENVSVGVVGESQCFKVLSEDELRPYIDELQAEKENGGDGTTAMDTSAA